MKKILLIILVFAAFSLPTLAIITPEEAVSEKYIQNHGHSEEMSRLIDLQNAQINCQNTQYKSKDPSWYSEKKVNFIRKVFMYFDCGLDDGKFMQHDTNYTNRWDNL